jgi:tRNA(Ile)-lysidine synthase
MRTPQPSTPIADPPPGGLLLAISGGADSTALALLLAGAKPGPVELAHVRHGLRPDAAGHEAAHALDLSRRLGIPLHVVDLVPPPGFRPGAKIPEAWARAERYRELAALARRRGLATIVTGHHAEDRRETQLLHVLRGGGLRALAGMPAEREIDGVRIWRPLLDREPGELRALLRERSIAWCEDASNRDLRLARNRLRHVLVPELRRRGDPLLLRADRLAGLAAALLARIGEACERRLDEARPSARARCRLLPIERARKLGPTLLRELLGRAAARLGIPVPRARRGELLEVVRWLADARGRGERRLGELGLQRSRDWLALFDPRVAELDASGAREDVVWVEPGRSLVLRPLREGEGIKRRLAALPAVERPVWPALFAGERLLWIPQLHEGGDVSRASVAGWERVAVRGLPDLRSRQTAEDGARRRAPALTRARTGSRRRSRSAGRRPGSSAA